MYYISIFSTNKSTSFFTSIKYVLPRNYGPPITLSSSTIHTILNHRCIQKMHLQTMELALGGVHMSLLLNFQCAALTGANSPLVLCWLMQASSLFGRSLIGVSGAVRGNTFHCWEVFTDCKVKQSTLCVTHSTSHYTKQQRV